MKAQTCGIPRKLTTDIEAPVAELLFDPIACMVRFATDPRTSPAVRERLYAELEQYGKIALAEARRQLAQYG